jgi:hypothetical protein
MTKGNDTWERLGTYVEELTDLTAGTVKDVASQWGGLWNKVGEGDTTESAMLAFRESVGLGIKATAKAWVATRDLMFDLAD